MKSSLDWTYAHCFHTLTIFFILLLLGQPCILVLLPPWSTEEQWSCSQVTFSSLLQKEDSDGGGDIREGLQVCRSPGLSGCSSPGVWEGVSVKPGKPHFLFCHSLLFHACFHEVKAFIPALINHWLLLE